MKTIHFKRFLLSCFNVNVVAAGCAVIKEMIMDYELQNNNPGNLPNNEDYQTAQEAFIAMGANLDQHPLQLTPLKNIRANVHANLLTGAYCLGYLHQAYDEFKRRSASDLSRHEFERAMYAHESIHAMEQHDLRNNYYSLMTALAVTKLCCSYDLPLGIICAIGPFLYFSTYLHLSRHYEFRADQLAAEKDPEIRKSLISIFSVPDQSKHFLFGFFEKHPTKCERRKALEMFKPSSPGLD